MTAPSPRDLADFHEPVSDFLSLSGDSWPVDAAARAKYALTPAQLAAYARDGYLEPVTVLNVEQVERLRDELAEIMDPRHPSHALWHEFNSNEAGAASGAHLFHSLGAWRIAPGFHDLLFHPAYLVPAAQLLGVARVRLWHDQIFEKPARTGSVVAWHQDASFWTRTSHPMQPGAQPHLTVHIALDAQSAAAANGSLEYVPGSQRWPLLPVTSRHFSDMDSISAVLDAGQRAQLAARRTVALAAGQAAFHHPLTVHGSHGNASEGARRAAVVNVLCDGTVSATDAPLLEGLPAIPAGQPLIGKFFPLLIE